VSAGEALKVAIDLFHLPSQVRVVRSLPLPKGTEFLLRLASGETRAAREAEMHGDRSANANRAAAIFFIEQILLSPESDEYRILGLDHTATKAELRAHMALLLKWLHPDLTSNEHKSLMARQVIEAWNKIKVSKRSIDRIAENAISRQARPDMVSPANPQPQSTKRALARRRKCASTPHGPAKRKPDGLGSRSTHPENRLLKFLSYVFRRSVPRYKN
jgi:hypothetical protein